VREKVARTVQQTEFAAAKVVVTTEKVSPAVLIVALVVAMLSHDTSLS